MTYYSKQKSLFFPGLLVSVDFEKVFDSTSWECLYNTMIVFGFENPINKWVKHLILTYMKGYDNVVSFPTQK